MNKYFVRIINIFKISHRNTAVDIAGSLMPKAFVVSKDVHNQETLVIALKAFLKERLSWYKCPQEIVFLDQMPLNDRGKILRKELVQT